MIGGPVGGGRSTRRRSDCVSSRPVDTPVSFATGVDTQRTKRLRSGTRQLRAHHWHGDPKVALVGPARGVRRLDIAVIHRCVDRLARAGVERVVTPALHLPDARVFLAAGFTAREELHLLRRSLHHRLPTPTVATRPGRRWHRDAALEVDGAAFEGFWQFDRRSLDEACSATPQFRFRLTGDDDITGYAVTGRAGNRGYLQRLAVAPGAQGGGLGSSLVADAMWWLKGSGADDVMVNTQERNQRALRLYRSLGFVDEPHGLLVLERDVR